MVMFDRLGRRYQVSDAVGQPKGRPRRVEGAEGDRRAEAAEPFVVQALWKGLQVLGLFDADHPEWAVGDIAVAIGIPKATAYRLVRTFEAGSFLVVDSASSRYHLGPAAVALTYLSRGYSELARVARPFLQGLATTSGETVNLAIEIDGQAVLVDEIRTERPFTSPRIPVGRIIGDTANSNGKIFAAFKSDEQIARIALAAHEKLTPRTIVAPEALLREFQRVREEGVAFDLEERSMGVCAVGAPVRDQEGMVVATISLVAPTGRFASEQAEAHAEAVREAAAGLSAFLGYSARVE